MRIITPLLNKILGNPTNKAHLKNILFENFPFLFFFTASYKQWQYEVKKIPYVPKSKDQNAFSKSTSISSVAYQQSNQQSVSVHKPLATLNPHQDIAIVIHAFYQDVFEEILQYLGKINTKSRYKLYISTQSYLVESINKSLTGFGFDYLLVSYENRGRDILPFIKLLPKIFEAGHEFIIKVHTKKSPHIEEGDKWRRSFFDMLLIEGNILSALAQFAREADVGILAPSDQIFPMSHWMQVNLNNIYLLMQRLGVDEHKLHDFNFVAGTMFMARTAAFQPLMSLGIRDSDFEEEAGQLDGTLAHALERVMTISAYVASYELSVLRLNENIVNK